MFRLPAIALIFLAATLWLAGCGDLDPHNPQQQKTRPDGSPWTVRYSALPDDPKSLDPQYAYEQTSHRVLECIYDTLLEYHPLKTDPYELRPGLLTAMPEREIHEDGKVTYTCHLKPGVRFHDDVCFPGGKGREIVAEDVHLAFQRMADPKVECPISGMLSENVIGFADATKAAEKAGAFDYAKQRISGLEVVDAHTFKIRLSKRYPQMLYWMAYQMTTPVPHEWREYYDGAQHPGEAAPRDLARNHPVGNGAFQFVKWQHDERITLVRNPGYTATTFPSDGIPPEKEAFLRPLAGHALPFVDELQIRVMREQFTSFLLMKQGYVDRLGVSKDSFGKVMSVGGKEISPFMKARGFMTEFELELSTFFFILNFKDPVLGKNRKLRQALSCAFDAKSQSEIFYNGTRPVAQQLIPPGIFGYEKDRRNPWSFDLEKARRLLAEAGYPEGRDAKTGQQLELTFDVNADSSELRKQVAWEQEQFAAIGVKVRIVENTFSALMRKEVQGDFQIASGSGWGADYPDPENFLFLFYSKNFPPNGRNDCRYNNPEYDKLFEEMAVMDDTPERFAICRKMQDMLAEDCPIIFNFHKGDFVLYPPWAPPTHSNMMYEGGLKFVTLDPVLRAKKRHEWNAPVLWPLWIIGAAIALAAGYAIRLNRTRNA